MSECDCCRRNPCIYPTCKQRYELEKTPHGLTVKGPAPRMVNWYILFDGTSPDGRGQGKFWKRTTDKDVALKHFKKLKKDPYATGSVRICTNTSYTIANKESDI